MRKAIVFDLDDTLFPEHEFVRSGFRFVGDYLRENRAIEGFFSTAWDLFGQGCRGNIFNLTLDRLGIDYGEEFIRELVFVYRRHPPEIHLFDDALWVLTCLNHDFKFGLISDGYRETQRNKVRALGIEKYFGSLIISDELGREYWKPSSAPYLRIETELGCTGEECVYVGDNPAKDFIGARDLGWLTIQVCRPDGQYKTLDGGDRGRPDFTVDSLRELPGVLNNG